jgi:hypothetical protein
MDSLSMLGWHMSKDGKFVTLDTCLLTWHTDRPILEDAIKLQGYISNMFRDYSIITNHYGDRDLQTDSRVQHKVINGVGYTLGIKEGAEAIKMLSYINELRLENSVYKTRPTFCDKEEIIAETDELVQYDLASYYLPYNKKNYEIFKTLKDRKEKQYFINNILRNNIVSLCKVLGLNIEKERHTVYVHSRFKESMSWYKVLRTSYKGEFRTNMVLPDLFGVGEKVSAGFGAVKRRLDKDHYLTDSSFH